MPKYIPLQTGLNVDASKMSLAGTRQKGFAFFADYADSEAGSIIRVSFQKTFIFKVAVSVDTPYEEKTPIEGLVKNHFGYMMWHSFFWEIHKESIESADEKLRHYRFVTPESCLDIIASTDPYIRPIITGSVAQPVQQ